MVTSSLSIGIHHRVHNKFFPLVYFHHALYSTVYMQAGGGWARNVQSSTRTVRPLFSTLIL
jgi:hypothetical protein